MCIKLKSDKMATMSSPKDEIVTLEYSTVKVSCPILFGPLKCKVGGQGRTPGEGGDARRKRRNSRGVGVPPGDPDIISLKLS